MQPPKFPTDTYGVVYADPSPRLDDRLSMRIKDAVLVSGISKDMLYRLIRNGELKSFTMGSRRFIEGASLRDYIAKRSAEPLSVGRSPQPRRRGGRAIGPADQPSAKT
jgi:excisionase family DNA binding protein